MAPGPHTLLSKHINRRPLYTFFGSNNPMPLYELANEYLNAFPERKITKKALISKITDVIAPTYQAVPKLNIEARVAVRLLPKIVAERLYQEVVDEKTSVKLTDGMGSRYDAMNSKIELKGALDLLHEIGHHIWNSWLICSEIKKMAVHASIINGGRERKRLEDNLIPNEHRIYGQLVGAYSGQFLEDPQASRTCVRMNDLEEHFARNYDLLLRGRPLDIMPLSSTNLSEMLIFYSRNDLIDKNYESLYNNLLGGQKGINPVNSEESNDGVALTRDELFSYHCKRLEFENGNELSLNEKIGLALDLEPDFVEYCLNRNRREEVEKALEKKGVTAIDFD